MTGAFAKLEEWLRVLVICFITIPIFIYHVIRAHVLYHTNPARLEEIMQSEVGYPMVTYASDEQRVRNMRMSVPFTLGLKDRMSFIGTHRYVVGCLRMALVEARKKAKVRAQAPNVKIYDFIHKAEKRILDYQQDSRPLVLNFGSCA